jgi:hypothetical protein
MQRTRKEYVAPEVRSERVEVGVFGQYGGPEPIPQPIPLFQRCECVQPPPP